VVLLGVEENARAEVVAADLIWFAEIPIFNLLSCYAVLESSDGIVHKVKAFQALF